VDVSVEALGLLANKLGASGHDRPLHGITLHDPPKVLLETVI
jgi:hypothetical protein